MAHILNLTAVPQPAPAPKKPKPGSWDSPIGWWEVCTEGDCEGRSIKRIGPFYGHVAEILFGVKDGPCYGFWVSPIAAKAPRKRPLYTVHRTTVSVALTFFPEGINTVNTFMDWMDAPTLAWSRSNYYNSFNLILQDKETTDQVKRQKALAKLNKDDRAALGLPNA